MSSHNIDFKARLNPEQYAAARHIDGPLLILAGAGSGKTRVLTHRIAHLVLEGGVEPRQILAVTFTNKAAAEMWERAEGLLTEAGLHMEPGQGPSIGTFHRTCARLLRAHGQEIGLNPRFVIYDESDQRSALKRAITAREIDITPKLVSQCAEYIDRCKNQGLTPSEAMEEAVGGEAEELASIYEGYQKELTAAGCMDFGDLLLNTVVLLRQRPSLRAMLHRRWRYVMVDEFQDTNVVQYMLLRLLVDPERRNLAVVGDDDQSIYGWRGATVRNILDFTGDHPDATVVKLEQNYRSTQVILDAAWGVIEKLSERTDKKLWTDQSGGPLLTLFTGAHEREEAAWVARSLRRIMGLEGISARECAVFYRTNAQARLIEEQLRAEGLGYQMVGGTSFYDRAEVKDILAYLKVALNPEDTVNLARIINTPTRNLGKKTVDKLENLIVLGLGPTSLYEAITYAIDHKLFGARQQDSLKAFRALLEGIRDRLQDGEPPSEVIDDLIEEVGYMAHLQRKHANDAEERKDHVLDLLSAMHEFEAEHPGAGLEAFLESAALVRDDARDQTDDLDTLDTEPITMMTVHASKGLEFEVVFVVGLEDGLFPLTRPESTDEQLDEERRLCYVALTRARKHLFLTNARRRRALGQQEARESRPSRFLADIPPELIQIAPESVERSVIWRDPDPSAILQRHKRQAIDEFDFDQSLTQIVARQRRKPVITAGDPDSLDQRPNTDWDDEPPVEDIDASPRHAEPSVELDPLAQATAQLQGLLSRRKPLARAKAPVEEPPEAQEDDDSLIGRIVTHPREGIGEIIDTSGFGPRATLTIRFANGGKEMKVVRRFVKIYPA